MFCELQVGNQHVKKARNLVAKKGTMSIIGREWLSRLRYKYTPENEGEWEVFSIEKDEELSAKVKQLSNDFPEKFERNGRIKKHQEKSTLNPMRKLHSKKEAELQNNFKLR